MILAGALGDRTSFGFQDPSTQDLDHPDLLDRLISEVRLLGLVRVSEQRIGNNLRAAVGEPFDPAVVHGDVQRLTRLGEFRRVTGYAEKLEDGSVAVIYEFEEQAIINEIAVTGNKLISDQELKAMIPFVSGVQRDDFLIENTMRRIEELYRDKGHYLTAVSVDQQALEQDGLLIFQIIEGPRVRVKAIDFRGNDTISSDRLKSEIKTKPSQFLLRRGRLDEDVLAEDIAKIDRFYKDRGYLDVRVDRTIELSPDNKEAKVVFHISEGRQYILRSIRAVGPLPAEDPLTVFSEAQIAALMDLKPGDVFSRTALDRSIDAIEEAYRRLGYLHAEINNDRPRAVATEIHTGPEAIVDLYLNIDEGQRYLVGITPIIGNKTTQDRVIRRELRMEPGRPYDYTEVQRARQRLLRTRLFSDVNITALAPDLVDPKYRDLLVEVTERQSGSIGFGVALGSDDGVFGEFTLTENNFDILDFPETWGEFTSGRAFRGAGQRFNMTFRPGNEFFSYSVGWTEPHLFESEYALSLNGFFRDRRFSEYDEERASGTVSLSRRLGDVWQFGVHVQGEQVTLDEIEDQAPTEIFADAGPDTLTSVGLSLTRTTVPTLIRPGRGSRFEVSFDQFGLLGGDYDFSKIQSELTTFFTLHEDFFGRPSILKITSRVGYIFGDSAPTYERFYLGGRTFRGFEFRTIAPKGIRADNGLVSETSVGGDWLLFLGAQYEVPIFDENVTGVIFFDSGTVTEDFGLDDYRLSVGLGVRLYIPALGSAPIAFDFGFPVFSEDTDEEQVLTFSAELPF